MLDTQNSQSSTMRLPSRTGGGMESLWLASALAMSGLIALALVATNGSIVAGIALVILYSVVMLTIYRVEWGFFIFVFFVLFFDQHNVKYVMPFTSVANYFSNINLIPGMPRYMIISAMELHLLFVLFVWIVRVAAQQKYGFITLGLKVPALLWSSALLASTLHGIGTGADPIIVIWEIRALLYLGILYWWTPQIIRTKQHIIALVWILIIGITIKALQGAFFYASNGFSFGVWPEIIETYTNHEDPVFMVLLFMLLGMMLILRVKSKQKTALLALTLPLLVGFISAQRRATYASGIASTIGLIFLLPRQHLAAAMKALAVFLVFVTIYMAVFWNSYSRLGYVAQQLKSTLFDEAGVRGEKDIESTLYRKAENFNLAYTFRQAPAIGIGYGKAYERPLKPWGGDFPLSDYIPHNQIFWIFVKMGAVGGFCFWFLFNSFVIHGSIVFRRLRDPYLQAVCAMCVISVLNQMVVSYVDMQLTFSRNMVVLGVLMGVMLYLDRSSASTHGRTTDD